MRVAVNAFGSECLFKGNVLCNVLMAWRAIGVVYICIKSYSLYK